jgi:pantoate--beta-alanine ligase
MSALAERWRKRSFRIGLVPTMGALHAGHVSLVRAASRECDRVVASIFVNPLQFGPAEDLARYPRSPVRDRAALARAGADVLFAPSAAEMYPAGFSTAVEVTGPLVARLCGPRRPGHFRGVATVVTKLFHAVRPHAAWFGRKDAQQAAVILRMTRDLSFGIRILVVPTVRERDGLAMSSRNACLSARDRRAAPVLARALRAGRDAIRAGARRPAAVRSVMRKVLAAEPRVRVQYLEIVNAETLEPIGKLRGRVLLAVAAYLGGTRLIDNLTMRAGHR